MRIARRIALAALSALCMGGAVAGTTTFAGANEFEFSGYRLGSDNRLKVCVPSGACHDVSGDSRLGRVISTQLDQVYAGSVVRGTLETQDPQGSLVYYSMEFDLHTNDFFSENKGAHIIAAPRAFLPFLRTDPGYEGSPYHGYSTFLNWPNLSPPLKVPHAYGNGLILGGGSPCNNGLPGNAAPSPSYSSSATSTMAIEHFIGPANTDPSSVAYGVSANLTACPLVRTINGAPTSQSAVMNLDDYSVYSVKVFVKQFVCPSTGNDCRTVGYVIQKTAPVFGVGPMVRGGGDESETAAGFVDRSAGAPSWGSPARSWAALQPVDRSSWYIGNVLTSNTVAAPTIELQSWSYQVKNLQVYASNTAPAWWTP